MNWNVLRYIDAIAKEGSFTKAADSLYVAQPSLSQAVIALEKELGAELFDRSGKQVQLTPSGEKYVGWAQAVLRSEQRIKRQLRASPGGIRQLTIGAFPYWCRRLLLETIVEFYEEVPGCHIELLDEYPSNISMLDEGKLDLIINLRPAGGYGVLPIAQELVIFAVPERFKLNSVPGDRFPKVRAEELLALPVIWLNDLSYETPINIGPMLARLYDNYHMTPDIILKCLHIELAHQLAAKGLGFTAMSELVMRNNMFPGVAYYEIEDQRVVREICAVWSLSRPLSEDAKTFLLLLCRRFGCSAQGVADI